MSFPWHRYVDDIDALFTPSNDWDFEVIQLGAGQLGYRACTAELPGVTLTWERLNQSMRSYQLMRQNVFFAGFVLATKSPVLWKGQEIYPDTPLIFGSLEQDMVLPAESLLLTIEILPDVAEPIGLMGLAPGVWHSNPQALTKFHASCRQVAQMLAHTQGLWAPDQPHRQAMGERIVQQFLTLLEQPANVLPTRQYEIMNRTENFLTSSGWNEGHCVNDLALAIGVSRRTMHRAFKDLVGIGPKGYLRLVRLHRFRQTLAQGDACSSVTEAALISGFDHFGRAARYYREQFGELPKQTRKRLL